jgi:hypothetical protein
MKGQDGLEDNRVPPAGHSGDWDTIRPKAAQPHSSREMAMTEHGTTETKRPHLHIPEAEELPARSRRSPSPGRMSARSIPSTFSSGASGEREISPDEFKRFRLQHGVYGHAPGRCTWSASDPLGDSPRGNWSAWPNWQRRAPLRRPPHHPPEHPVSLVKPEELTPTLRRLGEVGLTTREASGTLSETSPRAPMQGGSR